MFRRKPKKNVTALKAGDTVVFAGETYVVEFVSPHSPTRTHYYIKLVTSSTYGTARPDAVDITLPAYIPMTFN